jgi:hypothetical protein
MTMTMSRRTLKLLAWSYAVKTLIVAVTWVLVPDLPQVVTEKVKAAWAAVAGPSSE